MFLTLLLKVAIPFILTLAQKRITMKMSKINYKFRLPETILVMHTWNKFFFYKYSMHARGGKKY